MMEIPVNAVSNQTLSTQLASQAVTLNIYQKSTGVFMDVILNGEQLLGGVICQNLNRIVRNSYFGFVGDFIWIDSEGSDDPSYTGFGTRWTLQYLEAADIASLFPQEAQD
jgi:hypothetical protein